MRIATITATGLLALSCSLASLDASAKAFHLADPTISKLNTDIHNNRTDLSKDRQVAADQRADLARDRTDRNADQLRAEQDLAKGNYKGAAYWNNQRLNENAKALTEKEDLSHTYKDIKADRTRLVKDLKVRHHDIVKLSKTPRRT